jgi:hypothetical protein
MRAAAPLLFPRYRHLDDPAGCGTYDGARAIVGSEGDGGYDFIEEEDSLEAF